MISIRLTDNRLEVKGHAGYAEAGKDIVCAAVSVLVFTFCEVNKETVEVDTYTSDEICVNFEKGTDTSYLKTGFGFLTNEYPNNINLNIN